jgi:hypothetical protein
MLFGLSGGDSWYGARLDFYRNDGRFLIQIDDSGLATLEVGEIGSWKTDTWYRVVVTWDDGSLGGSRGDITMEVYEAGNNTVLDSITTNDTTFTSQDGVGWRFRNSNSSNTTNWDYGRLL